MHIHLHSLMQNIRGNYEGVGRFEQCQSVNRVHSGVKAEHHCEYLHCAMHNGTCASIDEMERFCNVFKWNFVEPYDYISNTSEWVNVYLCTFRSKHVVVWTVPCHAIPFHVRFVFAFQSISSCKPNTHTDTQCRTQFFFCSWILFEIELRIETERDDMMYRERLD